MTDEQPVLVYTLAKSIKDDHFGGANLSAMYLKITQLRQEVDEMYAEMYRQANAQE